VEKDSTTHPLTKHFLRLLQADYTNTGNPLFAWQAVQLCSKQRVQYPDWLNNYLVGVADQLMTLAAEPKKGYKGNPTRLLHAFSFGGRGPSKFKQWYDYRKRRESTIYNEILQDRSNGQNDKARNIEKLKDAKRRGKINEKQYKRMVAAINAFYKQRTLTEIQELVANKYSISPETVRNRRSLKQHKK